MAKYDQIRERYSKYCEQRSKYWQELQYLAGKMAFDFPRYLELEPCIWTDNEGITHDYIALGTWEGDHLKELTPNLLCGNDQLELCFVLRFTIDRNPNSLPKHHIGYNIRMRYDDEALQVNADLRTPISVQCPIEPTDEQFHAVFDVIVSDVMSRFDGRIFERG
ncbi:hypothetical protein A3218_00680 [Pseudomonas chlororaphis]|uniref:hypothetical protein n=1 Tax=Pseudomonas chlororaphis TaxID=587753 RepID=UPI000789D878|nr:hypothetical protein [Pseudomonas chlororaphis]AMS12913.1 hypothetical protein A3218_00680 [Pseudomonas chlororaphis]